MLINGLKPKIYYIKEVERIVGRNRLTLRRWWKRKIFPVPTLINSRLAWQAEAIHAWINENI